MNRKGVKRPLPCGFGTAASPCVVAGPGDSNNNNNNNNNSGSNQDSTQVSPLRSRSPCGRRHTRNRRRRIPPPPAHSRAPGRPEFCGCRRWHGPSATLRLAGVVGIHVLGLMACPCRGFTPPPSLAAGPPTLSPPPPDGQRSSAAAGDFGRRASIVCADGDSSSLPDSNAGMGTTGAATAAGGSRRGRPRDRSGDVGGSGGRGGGGGSSSTACRATRLPSAEEGPPLGLLYDRALLKAGMSLGVDTAGSNNGNARNGGNAVSGVKTNSSGDSGGGGGGGGTAASATATGARRDSEESVPAAAAAATATVVEFNGNSINNVAQNVTARWTSIVNGAVTAAADGQQSIPAAAAAAAAGGSSPAVPRKKWSGKGWLVSRAESEERQRPQQLGTEPPPPPSSSAAAVAAAEGEGEGTSTPLETDFEPRADKVNGFAAGAIGVERGLGGNPTSIGGSDSNSVGLAGATPAAANATGLAVATGLPMAGTETAESAKRVLVTALDGSTAAAAAGPATGVDLQSAVALGEAALQPPGQRDPDTELGLQGGEDKGDVCTAAREELTVYLLDAGATEDLVATATAALFAAEPRCSLTEGTWKRWRQNLDGLRSTGFTGPDMANMLALCPQLLALDYEGQVVPTMELLRQLGMRPTDVRRVVRKAPEVLAPRADGSTAAEAVDVLCALGLRRRHLKMEALRWPQLLAVPPGSFFQLAAFLASEEVGIKATNIASLIRQAPWLVLQPIDGQMLPVTRFLRIAGVTDVERVVRAYPKVLCASIKGELAPRVRFLWSDVGVSEEDLPKVLQTFPLLFALPLSRMQDVMAFLTEDLTINKKDTAKIIRAFPSLLGLERERHMNGVVLYLKRLGVQNVGRFVSRLPPVLGYDVNTNLAPKMDYLVEKMGLSVYDVLTFPAFFSYPLDTVIEPRTEFLNIRGRPITLVGLNIALQQGDADFARKVAKVQPRVYREFKEAYMENREAVKSGRADAESLLSEPQRKAIGNLGGQSTNNNVSEVTARATGLPPKRQPPQQKQQAPPTSSPPLQQQKQPGQQPRRQQPQQQQRQQEQPKPEEGSRE